MGFFQRLFGGPPRMELLEALLRLASVDFKRADLAEEAGVAKGNTNRVFPSLVDDGLVEQVTQGKQPTFRVNGENAYIRVLHQLEATLQLIEEYGPGSSLAHDAAQTFSTRMQEVTTAIGAPTSTGSSVVVRIDARHAQQIADAGASTAEGGDKSQGVQASG